MKAKILYVIHDGNVTGASISVRNVIRELDRSRFDPRVVLGEEGSVRRIFEELNVPVDHIPIRRFTTAPTPPWYDWDYRNNWLALLPNKRLKDYLLRISPDLVHVNEKSSLIAGVTAARLGLPVVWHLRGTYQGFRSWLQMIVSRYLIRRSATALISISEDETDGFEDREGLHVIYNSIDLASVDSAIPMRPAIRAEFNLKDDEVAVCKVGVLTKPKGAWDFIEAAGLAQKLLPSKRFRFFIMAPLPNRGLNYGIRGKLGLIDTTHAEDKAWELARRAGIEQQLTLTGRRPDPLAVMSGMDMIVACYRLHAMGRAAFEGMAVGRPVIVNAGHSGRSGVVLDNKTGLVIPAGSPQAMADAMVNLARDPKLRERLSANGLLHARRHFDSKQNAKAVVRVYNDVLRHKFPHLSGVDSF